MFLWRPGTGWVTPEAMQSGVCRVPSPPMQPLKPRQHTEVGVGSFFGLVERGGVGVQTY